MLVRFIPFCAQDSLIWWKFRVSGAGSFIRLSQNIYFGNTFLEALRSKYIEPFHGSKSQEVVILGSSQGAVQVEAVNLDKVRNKLARLSSLREVSLEGVAKADPQGMIGATCPSEGTAWGLSNAQNFWWRLYRCARIGFIQKSDTFLDQYCGNCPRASTLTKIVLEVSSELNKRSWLSNCIL